MSATVVALISGLYGLVIGSFLNVVVWRVPRKESIVAPPSHCPSCDTKIMNRDNIPVLSWILLRGRCRNCHERISVRYPLVELLTAGVLAAVGYAYHDSWALPAYLFLTAGLIALSLIDLEHFLLPTKIVRVLAIGGLALLALASLLEHDWPAYGRAVLAALVARTFFRVVNFIKPEGMGFGDVRLSFVLGLNLGWLGWGEVAGGLFAGFLYGAILGVVIIAVEGARGRKRHVPFGPFLALGTLTFLLFSEPILHWYHHLGR